MINFLVSSQQDIINEIDQLINSQESSTAMLSQRHHSVLPVRSRKMADDDVLGFLLDEE